MRKQYWGFLLFTLIICVNTLASNWKPKRIVGMNYPNIARMANLQGTIQLKCIVETDGSVKSVEFQKNAESPSSPEILISAATENIKKWLLFRPERD
jgi:outer membrane biosynthesis protein TonB